MLIKIGNSYYNDDYLAKLFAIDDGRYVIQYYNGFRQVLSAEEYAEVAEKYKVILNGEYWLNTDKIERVFSDDEKMVVEFKNGNPTAAKNETVEKMVEGWYQVGDYYYNPKYIIRLNEFDGSYFVQFTNGQTKKISEEEYEAILAIPQGPVTEEKTVALNMADGNQVIEKSADVDGMTKVTVEKPATLISANIKSGVNIGGVDGSLEFLTETKTVALDMASGDQVVAKSEDKDGMTEVTIEKPVTFVAENIKKDVDIGGVVGTYAPVLVSKTITSNGIYLASDDSADGYSSVDVQVSSGADADLTAMIDGTISSITNGASTIRWGAFSSVSALQNASFPNCTRIESFAFARCTNLSNISFPNCTYIGSNAFSSCGLREAIFPVCTSVAASIFSDCQNLSFASFPNITTINNYMFYKCINLETIYAPSVKYIIDYAFGSCKKLLSINFPSCVEVGGYAFESCAALESVFLGIAKSLSYGAFAYCSSISFASFPSCETIGNSAFAGNYRLLSLYLLGSSVPTLSSRDAFNASPISTYTTYTSGVNGSIFVRASLLTSFQTATNWVTYASRFVGLTDEQIAAL